MIIVFEGPDGVGKTTLIRELSRLMSDHVDYWKFPSPELQAQADDFESRYTYGMANLAEMDAMNSLEHENHYVFYDRFWPSTAVYNFNGELPRPEKNLPHVDLFVLVTAPYETFPASKGELTSEEFHDKLDKYKRLFNTIDTPHIIYDTTKDKPLWLLQALLSARSKYLSRSETADFSSGLT